MIDSAICQRLLGGERRLVVERPQRAGDPHPGRGTGLDVQVRAVELGQHHQESIEVRFVHERHCTGSHPSI